ncbi:MAG: hypothetical protein QW147_05000 [Candidatus Bathyarchaeia archaeon]
MEDTFSQFQAQEAVNLLLIPVHSLGGPLYTPTLIEIVLGRGIWVREGVILSKGALLSWLMGQPYDFANALAVSRITGWKVVVNYIIIAWAGSVTFGLLYGLLSGSL